MTVDGNAVTSGSESSAIELNVGANAITVQVTAQDGTTKDYTATITRQAAQSSNANLSNLTASSATSSGGTFTALTLTPVFSATTTNYAATVPNTTTHAKLTPTVDDTGKATVTVEGDAVTSGSESSAIELNVGANAITVQVTAQNGTTKDYIATITRQAAQSSNANLSNLTASSATSSRGTFTVLTLTPTFLATTTSYTATVQNSTTHAKLTPTVNDPNKATVTVDANAVTSGSESSAIELSVGANAITVQVTAQDGTTKDYIVTIMRQAAQSSNANLSNLTASSATSWGGTFTALTLTPVFSATATNYAATVPNTTTHAKLTPTVDDTGKATVTVGGNAVTSGSESSAIELSVGANAITVRVTAPDGTTKDYIVTITRQEAKSSNANLSNLTASSATSSGGTFTALTLTPVFSATATNYTATVPNTTTHAKLTPTVDDTGKATVTVAGNAVTSGSESGTIELNVGANAITVRVTAPDGTTKDYTVTITRQVAPKSTVSLSASPNPVDEGSPVTVTVQLSSALLDNVIIPLTLSSGTAEHGDYGPLSSIRVAAGSTIGTGTVTTSHDTDTDDETFTVTLDNLPSTVAAGSPSSAQVTISDDDASSSALTVSASCDPCRVQSDAEVQLTARVSATGGASMTYVWSAPVGRFMMPTDEAITRWEAPTEMGHVTIRVQVSDDRGRTSSATVSIMVERAPPVFGESAYAFELLENEDGRLRPVPLGSVFAEAPDGDEVTYVLVSGADDLFAVGARDGVVTYVGPGEDHEVEPNRYELTIRARGPHGAEAQVPAVVKVVNVNEPPLAAADKAKTVEDEAVEINVLANDTDIDGDVLRVESVASPSHGSAQLAEGGGVIYNPETDWYGIDRFVYTVADDNGGTAEAEVVVVVDPMNDVPEAIADTAATAEDEAVEINVLANDIDAEGDVLRVESVTAPSHGTTRLAAGGGVIYAPETDWHGTDRFIYTVADDNGGAAKAEVEVVVNPINDVPEAIADTVATAEDEAVEINVLANDIDVEGDMLRVESVTVPLHGTARIAPGGGVIYAPETGWYGTDRFTYTVTDGNGGTAEAQVVVEVAAANDAPVVVSTIPDQTLNEGGSPVVLDLASYFRDRDGDPLDYTAVPSDPGVAAVLVTGSALTLMPVEYGLASIEVTASDPGGLSATQTFAVNTSDQMVRTVLNETLAAMARAHVASARMTLSRRVEMGGANERSRLTVRGRSIAPDGTGVRKAAEQLLTSWTASRHLSGGGLGEADRGLGRAPAPAGLATLMNLNGLGGTEFLFVWSGNEPDAQDAGGGWSLWGQGDLQTFAADPVPEHGYEGDLLTGWAGVDRRFGKHWLAGVAVARSRGGGDWNVGTAEGHLETMLTAVHPYLYWSNRATSAWAMAGGGRGAAENTRRTGRVGESGLELGLGLVEVRHRLTGWFGVRADAAWARLVTGAGPESIDGHRVAVDQQRLGIELEPLMRIGALAFELFGEASVRRDGGAGQTGSGLEVAGGFRAQGGLVRLDAQARILMLHTAKGYEERGMGVTFSIGRPSDEEGLSLSVSPRWGSPTAAPGTLWKEHIGGFDSAGWPWSLDAHMRYALRLPDGSLFAYSGGFSRSEHGWGLTIGGGIELAAP